MEVINSMKFGMNPAPYFRSKRSTDGIMFELFLGLAVVWIAAIIYYFTQSSMNGVFAICNVLIAMATAVITEGLFFIPKIVKEKKTFKDLVSEVIHSYGYISGLILALILPVGTNWYAIVISTIIGVGVAKMLFGGFGHNIFNPAIVGRIVCQVCFLNQMTYDVDVFSGATITTAMGQNGWSLDILSTGNTSLLDLLLGNYRGTLGETFTILIFVVGIILAIRKVIDWRAPAFYLGTIFVTTLIMGLCGGYGLDSFEFALVQISLGGVMFGAIFCITDPVTSPTSRAGRVFFGMGAALITMLIRYVASAPEGVAYSILFMNMFTPLIDLAIKGLSKEHTKNKIITTSIMGAVAICSGLYFGFAEVDKMGFFNYQYSLTDETGDYTATVSYVSTDKDGIETYNASITGYLSDNTSYNLGDSLYIFEEPLKQYKDETKYPNAHFAVGDGASIDLVYTSNEEEVTQKGVLSLKTDDSKENWTIVDSVSGYWFDTDISTESSIYSISIDSNFDIILTLNDNHTSQDETHGSYATMDFDIYIDYKNQLVVGTKLNSTGAGGGYGDAMLDFDNVDYSEYLDNETAVKILSFYVKYVMVEEPLPFSTYTKYDNNSFKIEDIYGDIYSDLKTGATYTANAFMIMMNRVIEYANYYHEQTNAGKVVK